MSRARCDLSTAAVLITACNTSRVDDSHRKAINYYLFDEYHLWLAIYIYIFTIVGTRTSVTNTPITLVHLIYTYMII